MDGPDETAREDGVHDTSRSVRLGREIVWVALTIAFVVYLGSGRVSTYLGAEGRGRAGVWEVWKKVVGDLPGGDAFLLRVVYVGMMIAFVGGSLVALWLALAADGSDESVERPVTDVL